MPHCSVSSIITKESRSCPRVVTGCRVDGPWGLPGAPGAGSAAEFLEFLLVNPHLPQALVEEPTADLSPRVNRYCRGAPIFMLPASMTALLARPYEPQFPGCAHQLPSSGVVSPNWLVFRCVPNDSWARRSEGACPQKGPLTEEQQSPTGIGGATRWAAALLASCVVARSLQTHGGYARRSRLAGGQNRWRRSTSQLGDTTLAGMSEGKVDVLGEWSAGLSELLGNHVEHVSEFALRLLGGCAHRVASVNGRNIGHVTAVVVPPANHLVVEQRLHRLNHISTGCPIKAKPPKRRGSRAVMVVRRSW